MLEEFHPALRVWIRLLKTHNLILMKSRSRLAKHCTMAQFDILAQLSRGNDGTTLIDLSRRLLVTAGNVTGMIDRMERDRLVERRPDSKDRRVTRVHLTEKGKQLAETVIPKHTKDIERLFRPLKTLELQRLRHTLDKLIAGLEGGNIKYQISNNEPTTKTRRHEVGQRKTK